MIKLALTFIFLIVISVCYGQYRHVLIKDTAACTNCPLAILKTYDHADRPSRNYIIDNAFIESQHSISNPKQSKKPGDTISYIKFRKNVHLINVDELLKKYRIVQQYHDLPIYIDSILVFDRNNTYFQLRAVTSVKVQKEKGTNLKYINVHSIHHENSPIADVYINATYTTPKDN